MPPLAAHRLLAEIHRRSLWQVLGIYLGGGWVAYQVVLSLVEGLGLPRWLPPFSLALMILGLPIVLAAAVVISRVATVRVPVAGEAPRGIESGEESSLPDRNGWESSSRSADAAKRIEPSARTRTLRMELAVAGLTLLVVAAVLATAAFFLRPPLSVRVSNLRAVTVDAGVEFQPSISPDGEEVAYLAGAIGSPRLVIRSTARAVSSGNIYAADTSLVGAFSPAWSADGEVVHFRGCRVDGCTWFQTSRLGGAVRATPLPGQATRATALAWSPDGSQVAFVAADTIFVAGGRDTVVRPVAVHRKNYWQLHSLAWSPDGKRIAYVNGNAQWLTSANVSVCSIWVVDAAGGEPQPITSDAVLNISPTWLDSGHLLFVSDRDGPRGVYVVDVGADGARGEPRIVPGISDVHSITYATAVRKLVWSKFTVRQNIWSYPLGSGPTTSISEGQRVTTGNQAIEEHDVSGDGRWLAFDSNRRGDMDLYRMPIGGGEAIPVTDFPGDEFNPRWSPDGKELSFYARDSTCASLDDVMVIPAEGGVLRRLTCGRRGFNNNPRWSPDGLKIAFQSTREGLSQIWVVRRDSVGGAWGREVRLTPFAALPLSWTPDDGGVLGTALSGRLLVVVATDGRVLWRYDLGAQNGLQVAGAVNATYSRDGGLLYLPARHRDGRAGIWEMPARGGTARLVVAFDNPALAVPPSGNISVGRDRLYLTVAEYDSDVWVANVRF